MKTRGFIILLLLVVLGTALVFSGSPPASRIFSVSPSGDSRIAGMKINGMITDPQNGKLRLFVTHHQKETQHKTSIPWSSDFAIRWQESPPGETFVVEKSGRALIGFKVDDSGLKCTMGAENLADDPYPAKAE